MTSSTASAPASTSSPHRFGLWFALSAAPLAWFIDELASYLLASHLCGQQATATAASLATATSPWFDAMTAVTVLIAAAGLWTALRNWRLSRGDRSGSGRVRFMALCGLLLSAAFCAAFLYTLTSMVAAPLCAR